MTERMQISQATTTHVRKGSIAHKFSYGVGLFWLRPEVDKLAFFFGLIKVDMRDYGPRNSEQSTCAWIRDAFENAGLNDSFEIWLLTQPRILGTVFNPVSFWVAMQNHKPVAFIAEVNNTFHQRHFYLCHKPKFAPINPDDKLNTKKVFYVSPFQNIAGEYQFTLEITETNFRICIHFHDESEGVAATLWGSFQPARKSALAWAMLKNPFAGLRVLTLIYSHALKLKIKGAKYQKRPALPQEDIT